MKAKKLSHEDWNCKPGTYCLSSNGLIMTLPCGDNFMPQGVWQEKNVDDENKITLTPSIFCHCKFNGGQGWHGFLTNGEFISC